MEVIQARAHVDRDPYRVRDPDSAVTSSLQQVEDRWPLDVLHEQEREAVVLALAERPDQARMVHLPEDPGLPPERRNRTALASQRRRQDLARERAPLPRAPHLVPVAQPA